jgi:diguanylate cyclase (GGDEF)-like protein
VTQKIKLERALRKSMKNLEVMALRDSLTGLLNRRAITDYAASEMERAKRENSSICFALVDMDNLKEINDKYGHLVGDEALKKIGETINNSCRTYDKVGRWGGDEFLIIFSNNDRDGCSVLSNRIKHEVNRCELMVLNGKKIKLEICIGVVHYSMEHRDKTTVEELINRADEALYKAKQSGRNQVRFYSDI